jgi:hypothetical protein
VAKELFKINIVAIASSGLLMLLTGLFLYLYKDAVARNMRFFLPIPPIGVAAYVFVFNMFGHYDGRLPGNLWLMLREVLLGTVISTTLFCVFTVAIIAIIYFLK